MHKSLLNAAALLTTLATAGCATFRLPPQQLEANEASIRGAEELGASNVPAARLHLEEAKDETMRAKKMASDGNERAVLVLARSEADAELALGLAREATVHADALKASEELKAIQARGAQ